MSAKLFILIWHYDEAVHVTHAGRKAPDKGVDAVGVHCARVGSAGVGAGALGEHPLQVRPHHAHRARQYRRGHLPHRCGPLPPS